MGSGRTLKRQTIRRWTDWGQVERRKCRYKDRTHSDTLASALSTFDLTPKGSADDPALRLNSGRTPAFATGASHDLTMKALIHDLLIIVSK
jgi:hypothetical protein